MAMFLGTHSPRLDEKGRVILPAKYREQLTDGLVVTKGQERCLTVYPVAEFERMAAEMRKAPTSNKQVRDFLRVLLSSASDEQLDKQGRLTLPPQLRAYAGLQRDLSVVGAGQRLEIWDGEAWTAYLNRVEPDFAEQAQEVVPGLF